MAWLGVSSALVLSSSEGDARKGGKDGVERQGRQPPRARAVRGRMMVSATAAGARARVRKGAQCDRERLGLVVRRVVAWGCCGVEKGMRAFVCAAGGSLDSVERREEPRASASAAGGGGGRCPSRGAGESSSFTRPAPTRHSLPHSPPLPQLLPPHLLLFSHTRASTERDTSATPVAVPKSDWPTGHRCNCSAATKPPRAPARRLGRPCARACWSARVVGHRQW